MPRIDLTYGIVALVHQRVGQTQKADAAIQKGEAIRTRLLGRSDATQNLQYFSQYQTMLALVQNRPDDAAHFARTTSLPFNYEQSIIESMTRKGEVENALAYIGGLAHPNANDYGYIIDTLTGAGRIDQAEQVIRAIPGGTSQQAGYYWKFADKMAGDGDISGAQAYAKKHDLIQTPADQYRLLHRLVLSQKIGSDRRQAEPALRRMFSIAEDIDRNPSHYPGRWNQYTAQYVAQIAFEQGYTDLGIEFYRAATHKDQRPLLHAFPDHMKPHDMTPVLMLAQDNLQGIRLQYVIDAAMRHLQKQQKTST